MLYYAEGMSYNRRAIIFSLKSSFKKLINLKALESEGAAPADLQDDQGP